MTGWIHHPKFGLDVEEDKVTHGPKGMKGFTACIMRLSGESRTAPKQVQKWLEIMGKGDWLGVFMVVKG